MSEQADPARPPATAPPTETRTRRPPKVRTRPTTSLFEPSILRRAAGQAFVKLDPRKMVHVPVMFVVEIGSVITTIEFFNRPDVFVGLVTLWLWATVLFANFAEAVAEGRGKAQADTLRRSRKETVAHVLRPDGTTQEIPSTELRAGNLCVVTAGQVIPGDGDVMEGMAVVDESAITGESAPVIRESGGDRSAVTGGTVVLSDRIVVQITSDPGETFLDRMIALVEGASRQKTPNEIALDILIAGLTLILLVAVVTLQPMAIYDQAIQSTAVLVALFVCLAPTTIGGLLSAIGIAGMDRMVQRNVLAMSGRAVEAAGDCSTLLLDKTGTITYGNRMAAEFLPVAGATQTELVEAALLSSMADETPEGRSIVDLAETRYGLALPGLTGAELVPFSAQTRMSGVDLAGRRVRKGAAESVRRWVADADGIIPDDLAPIVEHIAAGGGTPLVVADGPRILGVIHLKDTVKEGMAERFAELRDMGIRTVMITGDNPLTAKAIAAEAGVDDFLAEATPEEKLALIRREQRGGHMVAMTGDGTNVLALLSVFVAGLMVGRTPEFLGKKIRATQMKLVVAYVLAIPTTVLILGSTSLVIAAGTRSILNPGLHGLTEVTYAYASVANNNGSAFAGLAANTPWYDTTLGLTMLIGRFAPIVLALAIAGSLAGARVHARTRATLDTAPTFIAFLLGVIVIVGGLIYFPMLILGPIGERIIG